MRNTFRRFENLDTAYRTAATVVGGLACLLMLSAAVPAATKTPSPDQASKDGVVARVGNERITESAVIALDKSAFDKQEADFALRLRQLKMKQAQDHYDLVHQQLDKLLDRRALELEAKARGTTTAAVLASLTVPAVTDDETHAFFEANKARTTQTFEQLQPQIVQYLANQHNTDATRSFYDGLRTKHDVALTLPPYRVAVAATGPSRGKEDAPVTIVEFADFQCPYCRQAEDALKSVMDTHSGAVRLVFRNLPLASMHPNATAAAVAGVCADRQGKFWEMHDAMFQDQTALAEEGLKGTAKRLGLDTEKFSTCLSDPDAKAAVETDSRAADELGITGTPYFLINGRPLYGSLPAKEFESVVTDELHKRG
jgi:protein-disulfide isomerase